MTSLHENKEPAGFAKDGLKSIRLDTKTGLPVQSGGRVELLTQSQIDALNSSVVPASPERSNSSIFKTRTPVAKSKAQINRIDNKLAVQGKTLPDNIKEVECFVGISEFPAAKNWSEPVEKFLGQKSSNTSEGTMLCPKEKSDQDQVANSGEKPVMTTNLKSNSQAPVNIIVNASTKNPGTSIRFIELYINGEYIKNSEGENLSYETALVSTGEKTVLIKVIDNFGQSNEYYFSNVSFGSIPKTTELTAGEIASLDVSCLKKNSEFADCNFSLPVSKTLPGGTTARIAGLAESACFTSGSVVSCINVKIPPIAGTYPIDIKINGAFVNTGKTIVF